MQLLGLLTTYEDETWLPGALGTLSLLDGGVIVEGAYQETIKLGKPPRSNDQTRTLCQEFLLSYPRFVYQELNEESDPQQRNAALGLLKARYGWQDTVVMIVDGDEEYIPEQISEIRKWAQWILDGNALSGILWSRVFFSQDKYVLHAFPRLFLVTEGCHFIDDNFVHWPEFGYTQTRSDVGDSRTKVLPFSLAATHHSYQISEEKFTWKRAGRVARWGKFPWVWDKATSSVVRV